MNYSIDDTFDSQSPYFNGALNLSDPPGAVNVFTDQLAPEALSAGELQGNTVLTDGYLQSDNFVSGSAGWKLSPTDAELNVSTAINSLDIPDTTTANSFHVDNTGNAWWGATTFGAALASISKAGAGIFTNVSITGGSVAGTTTVGIANLNVANRGWTQTCAFSVTDADTIAWGSGSFVTGDGGTTYSIGAGNTGNMAAKTYIYLDTAISTTAYQTTTTATTAVGAGKVLIAIAQNATGEATYSVLDGQGGQNIDAANIVANSITANELSTSITYAGTIVVDSAGAIRSGQTAYNTGTGWFIGTPSGTPKLSIGVGGAATGSLTWDGTTLTVNGYVQSSKGAFGGDGSLGALSISAGNTNLSAGSARSFVRNYTSISITGTGSLTLTTPHTNGTVVILKSQGAITLTSSAAPMIDCSAMGGAGGTVALTDASIGYGYDYVTNIGAFANADLGGGGGAALSTFAYQTFDINLEKYRKIIMGSGGGDTSDGGNLGATGGNGGGVLVIECAGAWNFTTASGISVNGQNGSVSSRSLSGGGGGGGGGFCLVLYNTLTANSGTITSAAGTGGNNNSSSAASRRGGGGAGGYTNAGSAGTSSSSANAKTGGDGGAGYSIVVQNTSYV